ncbi:hypothetical protein HAX54_013963, partial [Datura stramonium]|nr:hypothetical protein [Datura stramonium]
SGSGIFPRSGCSKLAAFNLSNNFANGSANSVWLRLQLRFGFCLDVKGMMRIICRYLNLLVTGILK